MLALPDRTVDHGNAVRLGITANATAEPAGQPHQVGVFERVVRSSQRPPPDTEPSGTMPHAEVRIQNDAIDAIVATAQQILIESAQPVCHRGQVIGTLPPASNCPAGATFSQLSLRKSIACYCGCKVRYRHLDGCAARLVGAGDRAIISVDENSRP